MPLKAIHLTPGERLFLRRRRRNWTQLRAAKELHVGVTLYKQLEADTPGYKVPNVKLAAVKPHEACVLLRRRSGLKQSEVAARMGVCRFWLYSMELGRVSPAALVAFWAKASA